MGGLISKNAGTPTQPDHSIAGVATPTDNGLARARRSGVKFYSHSDAVWGRPHRVLQDKPRYNPPPELLPLPFKFYGQPFYKGFLWETKV